MRADLPLMRAIYIVALSVATTLFANVPSIAFCELVIDPNEVKAACEQETQLQKELKRELREKKKELAKSRARKKTCDEYTPNTDPALLPSCGNGICEDVACLAVGCPVPESSANCLEDCPISS